MNAYSLCQQSISMSVCRNVVGLVSFLLGICYSIISPTLQHVSLPLQVSAFPLLYLTPTFCVFLFPLCGIGNVHMDIIHQDGNSIRNIQVVSSNRFHSTHLCEANKCPIFFLSKLHWTFCV